MMNIKTILALIIPTSILGFSFFWWKRKLENVSTLHTENKSNDPSITKVAPKSPMKREYTTDDGEESNDVYIEKRVESIDIIEPITTSSPEKRKAEDEDYSDSFIDFASESILFPDESLTLTEKLVVEEEVVTSENASLESENPNLMEILDQYHDEVTLCDIEKAEVRNGPCVKSGQLVKRMRHQSSCDGDSAFVEDYSSDNISVSGSDTALKSPEYIIVSESHNSSIEGDNLPEEAPQKKNSKEEKCRDWYGPALESMIQEDVKWGNIPMSDNECDIQEEFMKKTTMIGGVSLDKLSIVLDSESSEKRPPERKSTPKKSHPGREKSRKDQRRKSKSSPAKCPRTPTRTSGTPTKPESTKRKRESPKKNMPKDKTEDSERKGINGPWRDMDAEPKDTCQKTYDYEFPEEFSGKLIGKAGKHVKELKQKTGASICIEPEIRGVSRIISITGLLSQIENAESLLRARFCVPIERIIEKDINDAKENLSCTYMVKNEPTNVIVTAIIDAGNFFVQIFSSEVDEKIINLQTELANCYSSPRRKYLYSENDLPKVGDYCVSCLDNTWCRLKVIEILPEGLAVVSYVDYGSNATIPIQILLKIRSDFLELPIQAIECYLANVVPHENEIEYSYAATNVFSQLVEGHVLQATYTTTRNNIQCVELKYYNEESQKEVCVNKELENWGLVRWSEV